MKERIEICVDDTVLALNPEKRKRLADTARFMPTDRTPVVVDATFWTILGARHVPFSQFIESPRSHLREQILNYKWRVENIHDDRPVDAELVVLPDFGSLRGTEFPMEIEWLPDQPAKTTHLLKEVEDIDQLQLPDPAGGLNALKIEFYEGMKEAAGDFEVTLNGAPVRLTVTINQPGGPIPSAFAICGPNLFLWSKMDPERVQRLMDLVTTSHERCVRLFDEMSGTGTNHPLWLGADSGEMMGPKLFREMVAPWYNRLWAQYPRPRIYHMCGRINHLLDIIRDDMQVDLLDGFGFPTDKQLLAEKWAGRVQMRGGPHPMLVRDGPIDEIKSACKDYIHTAGSKGGYTLAEGFGLAPGTPPEHIHAMVEASKEAGAWSEFNHSR